MKIEGHLVLPENANAITNLVVPSGTSLPTASTGELFYLTADEGSNAAGLYLYKTSWVRVEDTSYTIFTDMQEPTGFVNRHDSIIAFTDATRTFTISPAVTSYSVYNKGVLHVKTTTEQVTINDEEGNWYIYFGLDGNIGVTSTFPGTNNGIALIVSIYWDATNKKGILIGEERHGCAMDWATHEYLHNTVGTRYGSGSNIGNYTLVGNGNNDIDVTISLTDGVIYDEDNRLPSFHSTITEIGGQFLAGTITGLTGTPTSTTLAKIPIFYRDGANGYLRKLTAGNAPLTKGTNRARYNKFTTTWALAEPVATSYIAVWIGHCNNLYEPIVAILGQREDTSLANAQTNNTPNALTFGEFPFREFKYLYRLIYQSGAYSNSYGARLRSITDYREVSSLPGTATPSQSHGSLSGLSNDNSHPATAISVITDTFNTFLTTSETDLQLALNKLDDHAHTQAQVITSLGYTPLNKAGDTATNLVNAASRIRQGSDYSGNTTATLDYSTGDYFKVTATGNLIIAVSNLPATYVASLTMETVNFGAYTITWPAGIKWSSGSAPAFTASGTDMISILKDKNEVLYGFLLGRDVR